MMWSLTGIQTRSCEHVKCSRDDDGTAREYIKCVASISSGGWSAVCEDSRRNDAGGNHMKSCWGMWRRLILRKRGHMRQEVPRISMLSSSRLASMHKWSLRFVGAHRFPCRDGREVQLYKGSWLSYGLCGIQWQRSDSHTKGGGEDDKVALHVEDEWTVRSRINTAINRTNNWRRNLAWSNKQGVSRNDHEGQKELVRQPDVLLISPEKRFTRLTARGRCTEARKKL